MAPAQADVVPVSGAGWTRWAGPDRYATAVEVSKATFTPVAYRVVSVVSGENYPDALAAGPVAGFYQTPVLLTKRDSLPAVVAAELDRLNPTTVEVVGGEAAISHATALAMFDPANDAREVVRMYGADRYETAALMARGIEQVETVYIASGESFADALAAGPAAGKESGSLVLTRAASLPTATSDYLAAVKPSKIVIVGGPAAISAGVEESIKALVPSASIVRHGGRDRYDTARLVALATWPTGADTVFYAPGNNFPDALAATPAAIVNNAPLLLTRPSCHPYETTQATQELAPVRQVAVGGEAVTYAGSVTCGPLPTYPFTVDLDCKDYPSQAAAQEWFDYWYPRVGDVFRLDGDNDLKVCEVWRG